MGSLLSPQPRELGEARLGCPQRWPACHVARTTVLSLGGVFGALGLLQEGLQKVVRCRPVTKPGHCPCFEWEKTARVRNLEEVEDHFGNLLFKTS